MKRVLLYLLLLMSLPAQASPTLLVVGDSLSAGYGVTTDRRWVTLLEERLHKRCAAGEVINASVSGDTSSGGVSRLPPLLQQHHPELVIVELGGNDGLRGIGAQTMRQNLLRMVKLSKASGAQVLLLGVRLPANYGPDFVNAFHQVYYDVAEAASVPLVPFLLEGVALDRSLMQGDGIHPNDEGQPRLLENVWSHLAPMLGDPGSGFDCREAPSQNLTSVPEINSPDKPE